MLETKDLCKTYTPKKGVPVKAVDHVSLRFPEKGMVFLLGKSGSGKSTMLNLLGGLDQYDDGEIIIKGISSKDFDQQRFDSYRNTYVGFIFQEYNVLEEFTVGANIALALELQSKEATDERINAILKAVDLEGFGDRKPNELSGGQKQRVAIARALIKDPQIIMADEPTGALDSGTGRQVLDTLKKLSAEKLVIVVSHDREYAEQYADRIIEMADGQVIRDVTAKKQSAEDTAQQLVFRASSVEIPPAYHLTEEDRIRINEYLDQRQAGVSLMLPGTAQQFTETDTESIPAPDGSDFHLIKSKLPIRSAFKIGCSSLKHKRFRLVMTILLSVTAFTLFALVDTFSAFDHNRACTDSLIDTDVRYLSVNRSEKHGKGLDSYWSTYGLKISEEDMKEFSEQTGVPVKGIFIPRGADLSFDAQYDGSVELSESGKIVNMRHFCGFAEITEQSMKDMGFKLIAGKLPDGNKDEIAVSEVLCDTFVRAGYAPYSADGFSASYKKLSSPLEMVGKSLHLMDTDYTVTAVIDTGFDLSRYESLRESDEGMDSSEQIMNYIRFQEYNLGVNYSLTGCAMLGEGAVQRMVEQEPNIYDANSNWNFDMYMNGDFGAWIYAEYFTTLDKVPDDQIVWLGEKKSALADNEVIVSLNAIGMDDSAETRTVCQALYELQDSSKTPSADAVRDFFSTNLNSGWTVNVGHYNDEDNTYRDNNYEARIAGILLPGGGYTDTFVIPETYAKDIIRDDDGIYDSIVGALPQDRAEIRRVIDYCYRDGDDITERYEINHAVTFELDASSSTLEKLAKVFLYIGIFFAVFAGLLMSNFITTSIHYKRQEIGILRAIGSRSADVFRIFFSESFVIAMINLALSSVLGFIAVTVINYVLRKKAGLLVTVLHFGIRQIILLAVISVAIAAVSSFLPVHKIASKRPIDAIRDR